MSDAVDLYSRMRDWGLELVPETITGILSGLITVVALIIAYKVTRRILVAALRRHDWSLRGLSIRMQLAGTRALHLDQDTISLPSTRRLLL